MIKKILFPAIFAATIFIPFSAFAATTLTVAPTSQHNGNEASFVLSFTADTDHSSYVFLFNPSNNSVYDVAAHFADGSYSWNSVGFGTSLTPGSYTVLSARSFASGGATPADFNAICGSGISLSSCSGSLSAGEFSTFGITISSSTGPIIAPINDVSSTINLSGMVYTEIVSLPIYELKNYETPLVGLAIILALFFAIFAVVKLLKL